MIAIASFIFGFVFASFLEYWIHRFMHQYPWFGKLTSHDKHHRQNDTPGVLWDFKDYGTIAILIFPTLLISWSVGIGLILGSLVYAAVAAYVHQLQHVSPNLCFWMKVPSHYLHHQRGQCHTNFGLTVDWWDHVFGTYQTTEWWDDKKSNPRKRAYLQVKWW